MISSGLAGSGRGIFFTFTEHFGQSLLPGAKLRYATALARFEVIMVIPQQCFL